MGIKANEMIVKLMGMGVMATVNQTIDYDTAALVAGEFGYEVEKASFEEEVILKKTTEDDPEKLAARPPRGDHHGSCRPRQDIPFGRDPQDAL